MAISDITPATPASTGLAGQGDDELRQLKTDVQECWPALDGEITNDDGVDTAGDKIQPDAATWTALFARVFALESTGAANGAVLQGMIVMWSGTVGTIPTGWELCDGVNGTNGFVIPDLTDRFVVCAGNTFNPGDIGGTGNGSGTGASGAHTHGGATSDYALAIGDLPTALSGNVTIEVATSAADANHNATAWVAGGNSGGTASTTAVPMDVTGANSDGHSHPIPSGGDHQHAQSYPLYYALAYICYVGA